MSHNQPPSPFSTGCQVLFRIGVYFLYREGRYTREDFERLWPQLLEIARKENDWEILSTVRMLSPKEWWQDKWRQVLEEINRKT